MRLPLINSSPSLQNAVQGVLETTNRHASQTALPGREEQPFALVTWDSADQANQHISYDMPPLLLLNFAPGPLDAFALMEQIRSDPWLHFGGIIALYDGPATFERLDALTGSNIIVRLGHHDVERQLGTVLEIIRSNRQILFQRALQTDLLTSVSGQFELDQNLLLVPAYANLVSNYLFNVGFLAPEAKAGVSLALTEMLMNAVEHGNCGITSEEKQTALAGNRSIQALIMERCANPLIRNRRVRYHYQIEPQRSVHIIRDEGHGFDWRQHMTSEPADLLAEHGRGIMLARQFATLLSYNTPGNEVTLEFHHSEAGGPIPAVLRNNETLECAPGDVIFNQGEASDHLYFVASGEFHVIANGRHVANVTPADLLTGDVSLLLEQRRGITVIAHTAGRLVRISKQEFIDIIRQQPYYGLFVARLLARRLHRVTHGLL